MKCLKTIIIKQNKHGQAFISSKFLRPIWSSLFPENNKIKKVLVFSNTYPWFSCIVLGLVFTHIGSHRAIPAGSAFSVSTLPTYVSLQKEKKLKISSNLSSMSSLLLQWPDIDSQFNLWFRMNSDKTQELYKVQKWQMPFSKA